MIDKIKAWIEPALVELAKRIDDSEARVRKMIAELPAPKDGRDGVDGKDGEKGADGVNGKDGEPGKDGRDGVDGRHGKDGADGKDAIHLDILPAIDPEKSYPRGTYATHNGGLFRAYEKTHGLRGWECIVDGVADFEIEQAGERGFKAIARMASGRVVEKAMRFPFVVERGVYVHGNGYEQGDGVTWAGSYWIAQKDAPQDKPGEGDGWRLAVKRGRDGKDGRNGIDMTKGVKQ